MAIFKTDENEIICPSCGEFGLVETFKSKMNGELIYRCYECYGIYESLCDLEYNVKTQVDSGYTKMIGVKNFELDTVKIGRLTTADLEKYDIQFEEYPKKGGVYMFGKGYFGKKVIIGGFQTGDNNVDHLKQP